MACMKLAALVLGAGLAVPPAALADDHVSDLGHMVLQDCGSCHGMTLRGGLGPALRPENLEQRPVSAIAAIIREGVPGTAMPPWKALLSDEEILWISEQLKSGTLIDTQ